MNRRRFMQAAGTAWLSSVTGRLAGATQARRVDLLITGGRVIDPSVRLDAVCDIAIANGRIAAVQANLPYTAAETLDARGKLVVPGLIDLHTHCARVKEGPGLCLADGVTGFIDAGSQGADRIDEIVAVARTAPQACRVMVNIGRAGILPDGDTRDLSRADVAAARRAIERHRDLMVGVKARLSREVAGDHDLEVLRRAHEVVAPFGLHVMIHMGQTTSPIGAIMDAMRPGDIVTHMFAPPPSALVDEQGRIDPAVLAARRRGVWFDVGNGRVRHLRWDTVEQVLRAGFWPDSFSTDWTVEGRTAQVFDLPNCMSKFLELGMPLADVIARATLMPSRVFEVFRDKGTLHVGAPADVAVLELREGRFEFVDNYGNTRVGAQRLFPFATILGGRRVTPA